MLRLNPVLARIAILLTVILGSAGLVASSVPSATWFVPEGTVLSAAQVTDFLDAGGLFFSVQSAEHPSGEIGAPIAPAAASYPTDAGDPFSSHPGNAPVTFGALLGGDQVSPRGVVTRASAYGSVTLDPVSKELSGFIVTSGIAGRAATINDGAPGASGAVLLQLEGGPVVWTVPAHTVLSEAQSSRLSGGACYFNVQSDAFPAGELRGQLDQQVRFAALKGAGELPPVASAAGGTGYLALNPVTRRFSGFVTVSGLDSAVTAATIRFGDAASSGAGIIDLVDRGNGVWSTPVLDNPALSDAVLAAFNSEAIYFEVRTLNHPAGELRGQLVRASVRVASASLDGGKVVPPVPSEASGTGMLAWNSVTGQLSGSVTTVGITGSAARIHSGPLANNGPTLVELTAASPVSAAPTQGISFGLDIQPIFNASCARSTFCHVAGGAAPMSLQRGVSYTNIINLLVPGAASESYFFQRVTGAFPPQMPLNRPPLSAASQDLIKSWIDNGALFDYYPVAVTLTASPASPQQAGIPVTLTATVQQGGSYHYRFWADSGTGPILIQDYSAANTLSWIPATSGAYGLAVDVRVAGSTALLEASAPVLRYQVMPAPDTVPDPFSFTSRTGAAAGALVESDSITVTGINAAAPATVTGGEFSISTNGGLDWSAFSGTPGSVSAGNLVKVRLTSSPVLNTLKTAVLTIGGVAGSFNVTTLLPSVSGTLVINGGAAETGSAGVLLALSATSNAGPVTLMQFSKDGGASYFPLEPFATARAVTLLPGNGPKTMTVRFRDAAGNLSAPVSDSITLSAPLPTGTIVINAGAAFTNSQTATLALTATGTGASVTLMQFSKDGGASYFPLEPFATTRTVTLLPGDGLKTMTVRFKDSSGNLSIPVSDSITLSTAPPAGTIVINGGAAFTNSQTAVLTLSARAAAGSVTQMQFSKDGGASYFALEPFATARTVTLLPGNGPKTMTVRFKDSAGNLSAPVTAGITLDTTPPTGTISFATPSTSSPTGTLTLSASDASGVTQMQFSKNGVGPFSLEPFATSRTVSLAPGLNTLTVRFQDAAGNLSAPISATITRN